MGSLVFVLFASSWVALHCTYTFRNRRSLMVDHPTWYVHLPEPAITHSDHLESGRQDKQCQEGREIWCPAENVLTKRLLELFWS